MNSEEIMQKERALEIGKVISQMDFSKYGYHFDHGPITEWISDASGNGYYFYWRQQAGFLSLEISICAKFNEKLNPVTHDSIFSSLVDMTNENRFMLFDFFEKEKKHPILDGHLNWSNTPLTEFAKNYEKLLIEALDTYLNDFIMGRRFIPDRFDRGDY